jgi:hypothetical protein
MSRSFFTKMNVADRAHLDTFLTAIDASPIALERPVCRGWVGDYQITGKHGHVLSDHPGYLLYVTGTVQRWKKAKRILPGTVTRDRNSPTWAHDCRGPMALAHGTGNQAVLFEVRAAPQWQPPSLD